MRKPFNNIEMCFTLYIHIMKIINKNEVTSHIFCEFEKVKAGMQLVGEIQMNVQTHILVILKVN